MAESPIAAAAGPRYAVRPVGEKDAMASDGRTPRRGLGAPADGTAAEVAMEPQAGSEQRPSDTPATPEGVSGASATPAAEVASESVPFDAPAAEPGAPVEVSGESKPADATEPVRPAEVEVLPPPRAPRRRSLFWPMVASAIFGAVLGLAALAVIWRYNVLEPYNIDVGGKLAGARIAALEARLRAIQPGAAPAPVSAAAPAVSAPPADTKALDELTARVAKLEAALQNPKPAPPDLAVASRFAALEGAIKPLGDAVNAANKRVDDLNLSLRDTRARLD